MLKQSGCDVKVNIIAGLIMLVEIVIDVIVSNFPALGWS